MIITFYVQNVHRWLIRKSAVSCGSLSLGLQRYQWMSAAKQTRSVAVRLSTRELFVALVTAYGKTPALPRKCDHATD